MIKQQQPIYVLKEECEKRLHIPKWAFIFIFTVFFGLMSVFLSLVAYAASDANDSMNHSHLLVTKTDQLASDIETQFRLRQAEQKAIINELDNLKSEVMLLRQQQAELLKKIWAKQ